MTMRFGFLLSLLLAIATLAATPAMAQPSGGNAGPGPNSYVVTANGVTNTIPIWMSYLSGSLNPSAINLSPPGNGPGLSEIQALTGTLGTQNFANNFYIAADDMNLGTAFSVGWNYSQLFGGAAAMGGRVAVNATLNMTAPTSPSNSNRNYVGLQGGVIGTVTDNGTDPTSGAAGAFFGFSSYFRCYGQNYLECAGGEINSFAISGSSMKYKNLLSLVGGGATDVVQGTTYDTMLALSDQTSDVGHQSGILFGPMNGQFPITASGTLIQAIGGATMAGGIDLSQVSFTGNAFASTNFRVDFTGSVYANGGTFNHVILNDSIQLVASTVAGLGSCTSGNVNNMRAVTDATAPTYNAALTGGGTVHVPVFCNGTAWTAH